jgi:hypothetical protein
MKLFNMPNIIHIPFDLAYVKNEREFEKIIKHYKVENAPEYLGNDNGGGVVALEGKVGTIMVLTISSDIKGKKDRLSALVHEITHIKQYYLRWIGEDEPSDEFEAYLMNSLFEMFYEEVIR